MGSAGEPAGRDPNAVLDSEKPRGGNGNGEDDKAGWRDLPNTGQLAVITLARLSEPLVQTSLQSYVFYQLQWFDPSLPEAVILGQAGVLHASYMAVQVFTAVLWGRVADAPWAGRKTVIMIGLIGRLIACLGFGFATTFYQALFFRCLAGLMNANVAVMRTVISEIVQEKKHQPRAFLLLPMTFNIGVIIGPLLGGFLADPAQSYPSLFGSTAFFIAFPYALPNLVSAAILASALILVWLCLDETLNTLRSRPDRGRRLKTQLGRLWTRTLQGCLGNRNDVSYTALPSTPPTQSSSSSPAHNGGGSDGDDRVPEKGRRAYRNRLPFRRLFTRNVVATLAAHFALALHLGAFTALLFVFLATPVFDPAAAVPPGFLAPAPPFRAAGGLGLPAADVGVAMALFGVFGITAQLLLYPRVAGMRRRRGGGPNGGPLMPTIWSWRLGLALFPAVYALVPLLTVVPSSTAPPGPKTGPRVWAALAGVLGLQVLGRTFALPAQAILLNNSVPHPSVLATLHGLSQSVASLARAVGPAAAGWLYGAGLVRGLVGAVFWGLAAVAAAGLGLSFLCREGDGHEIRLEGDAEE